MDSPNHLFFMRQALTQAKRAYKRNEVPVGAVVVYQNTIISRGYNQTELRCTQSAHAEAIALARAGKKRDDWRLGGCWLYVTLQPCASCFHLVLLSRVAGIVYAAPSPLFGYHLDKTSPISIYKDRQVLLPVISGVCETESVALLKGFFKEKRNSGEGYKGSGAYL